MIRAGADWVAARETLPPSLRAVAGFYADAGVFDVGSLRLKRRVDAVVDGMVETAFDPVEAAVAEEFGHDDVSFAYDTKLVMPAKLTLGYCYRRLDAAEHGRAEAMTRLAVEALLDGDMRDAINDDEFEDFEVDVPLADDGDRRRVATVAQETLSERVRTRFADYPDEVEATYDWAVEISEAHQDSDARFRDLLEAAQAGDPDAEAAIREEYRDLAFEDPPSVLTPTEREIPYVRTQYDRVGVIYDGMIEMYRAADLPVSDAFKRAIVLAIVGAQIWLDDIDDYEADVAEGQLTPVTAEYRLAETDREAYDRVVSISERYLDLAKAHATEAESPLTGIATEYIYRSGDPGILPGAPGNR